MSGVARNRVVAARVPRTAAAQSMSAEPTSTQQPVRFQGLLGILRAAGMETARRTQHWADEVPVSSQQHAQHRFHVPIFASNCLRLAIISRPGAAPYGGRTS